MNDTENETVRFSVKPSPFFYALELMWRMLLVGTAFGGIVLVFSPVLLLGYFLVGLAVFMVAFVTARYLMFVATDKRVVVRSSFGEKATDQLSIAIETVKRIEVTPCGAAHGSVYLTCEEPSARENSKDSEPDDLQPRPIRRAFVPVERTTLIFVFMNHWTRWLGFYGFKGFDEFAKIISEPTRKPAPPSRT